VEKENLHIINYNPSLSSNFLKITEEFKGEVEKKEFKFPSELGEEHPFDFRQMENLYKKFGLFSAIIDKYIDYIVGPGFYIICEDDRAKTIIEDFMQDVNFDTILRAWCKEALIKGNGFVEIGGSKDKGVMGLKVLNANYMYIVRDKKGLVQGYNQYKGDFDKFAKNKTIPFKEYEIAHIPFNKIGDCAYGYGMAMSSMQDVNNLLQQEKDEHMIINRKANSPLHAKLGKVEGNTHIIPKREDVEAFGQKMETMDNKTDWATDALVDLKVVDFGNIGDKFTSSLEYDLNKLFYDYQIPPVIMGKANVPEGLARVQMEGFQRRIQSIQAEIEKIIEEKIFKRILNANGFDIHVEFEWGTPSILETEGKIKTIIELLKGFSVSLALKDILENELVNLLKLDKNVWEEKKLEQEKKEEEERQRLEQQPQPIVPGQNKNFPQKPLPKKEQPPQPKPKEKYINRNYEYEKECKHCKESWDEVNDISEWLGFKYNEYLKQILLVLNGYDFNQIKALNENELLAGYLTETQINDLKKILEKGFKDGLSIKEIASQVDKKLNLKDLYRMNEDGTIKTGASGLPILQKSKEARSIAIVRSEITRLANLGALEYYKEKNISKIRWVSSFGNRTCPQCESLDGQIYNIGEQPEIPLHPLCRCTYVPISELK